jgi:fibro-slime domain-containing protein
MPGISILNHRVSSLSSSLRACLVVGAAAVLVGACTKAQVSTDPAGGGEGPSGGGQSSGNGSGAKGGAGGSIIGSINTTNTNPVTGKGCGNGKIDESEGEGCDDGNKNSGDGCNAICQTEANWLCEKEGQPCENLAVCGNGHLTSDEVCDDGNKEDGDGCSKDCQTIESGWQCRVPGKPCTPKCGDGVVSGYEQCDDGKNENGDGCSALCKREIGWDCTGSPSVCKKTVCGNGKTEGGEGCDDGNAIPFDGCSLDCQIEPDCTSGDGCVSTCGDGIVFANSEECDDGNRADGDGCSKDCKKEKGWTCTQKDMEDKMLVPMVARDFKYHNPADFEVDVIGQKDASKGMVENMLNSKGKPVYTGLQGGAVKVTSKDTFAMWYTDVSGTNHATVSRLALWYNGNGYVNRYGEDGTPYYATEKAYYCGKKGEELLDADGKAIPCTSKTATTTECTSRDAKSMEMLRCFLDPANPDTYQAIYITQKLDGNPLWFPCDGDTTITPKTEFEGAKVPPMYEVGKDEGGTWPYDFIDPNKTGDALNAVSNRVPHNFSFTTEVRYWFKFETGKTYQLEFVGDDDVWVFVNRRLAVDIGGVHMPVKDSVDLAAKAKDLNLKAGSVYEVAVFSADRHRDVSTYKLTLSGFNSAPNECVPECGDGAAVADEECDNGKDNNDETYGGCTKKCTWGGYCGDGITNGPEQCDEGSKNGTDQGGGCTAGCTRAKYCGDGSVDTDRGEQCDLGEKNGQGSLCTKDCRFIAG